MKSLLVSFRAPNGIEWRKILANIFEILAKILKIMAKISANLTHFTLRHDICWMVKHEI